MKSAGFTFPVFFLRFVTAVLIVSPGALGIRRHRIAFITSERFEWIF